MSNKISGEYEASRLKREETAEYSVDELGHEKIIKRTSLKTIENIGIFPEPDVKKGDTWIGMGKNYFPEIANAPIEIPVYVKYEYLGKSFYTGENKLPQYNDKYDVIRVSYNYIKMFKKDELNIKQVEGKVRMLIYFDNKAGKERYKIYRSDIKFLWQNGFKREFIINSVSRTIDTKKIQDKESVVKKLKKSLYKYNAEIKKTDEGLSINILINFKKNSAIPLASEKSKLEKLAKILSDKKFKDRNILIKGHTAKFLGISEKEHIKLSQARADKIANYLLKNKVLKKSQVLTLGVGSKDSLYKNDTPEHMKKNRRVEIIILDN